MVADFRVLDLGCGLAGSAEVDRQGTESQSRVKEMGTKRLVPTVGTKG